MTDPAPQSASARHRRKALALGILLAVQALCLVFLVADAAFDIAESGGPEAEATDTLLHGLLELGIVLALVSGVVATALEIRSLRGRVRRAQDQLRLASGAFHELMEEHFESWGLTPAEREVALFSIKGLSNAEIAALRETREGTVKAQLNAIYAKAGVTGRPQLLGLFIEELMAGPLPGMPSPGA